MSVKSTEQPSEAASATTDSAAATQSTAATAALAAGTGKGNEAAHESAEPAAKSAPPPTKVEQSKMSTVDLLRAKKQEREQGQGRAANTTSTNAAGSDPSSDAKDDKGAEAVSAADLSTKEKSESAEIDDDVLLKDVDMNKAGWFDRLKPEQREALDRKYPGVSAIVNAGKAEAQRHVERAKQKVAASASADSATNGKPTAAATETAASAVDLSEAIDLLYDPKTKKQGLTMLLSDPDAAEIIHGQVELGVKAVLSKLGVDLDEQIALQPVSKAIELAGEKYPQLLSDQSFFDEVDELMKEDGETYDELMQQKNPRLLAVALREASATVVRSRAAKKPATPAAAAATSPLPAAATAKPNIGSISTKERRENLERNTQAQQQQAAQVAGRAGSRTASSTSSADPESTVELLRRTRADKGYRFVGQ